MNLKKNYYELLDVSKNPTEEDVEEAYNRAIRVYGDDSMAAYSLYTPEEKQSLLEELRRAYETLSDPERKREYDTALSAIPDDEDGTDEINLGMFRPARDEVVEDSELTDFTRVVSLREPLLVSGSGDQAFVEQYRILFTKLDDLSIRSSAKVFAMTSSVKNEGKTITSLNLSYVMASEFRKKVALVECDLRHPTLSSYFDMNGEEPGVNNVVRGDAKLKDAMVQVENTGLYILPAGTKLDSPEPLGSLKMKAIIKKLKEDFDYVILDSPPILPLADINIISRLADGLLVVIRAGKTPRDKVQKALQTIPDANIVGVVLNGTEDSLKSYHY